LPAHRAPLSTERLATPPSMIEAWSGGYLGEDDIVRVEDVYQRT
jgi:mannose-6-phosphate isomerase-like protein (cupin superfamily)